MFSRRSPEVTLPLPRPAPLLKNSGSATGDDHAAKDQFRVIQNKDII